jgi:hypothetical protein
MRTVHLFFLQRISWIIQYKEDFIVEILNGLFSNQGPTNGNVHGCIYTQVEVYALRIRSLTTVRVSPGYEWLQTTIVRLSIAIKFVRIGYKDFRKFDYDFMF